MAGFGTQPFGSSAFGGTNPSGAVASTPKVRDTVTSRKHVAQGVASAPKIRDTVTGTPDRGVTVVSTPRVRDTVTAAVGDRAAAAITSTVTAADSVVAGIPATRLYLPSAGAAPISPAYAAEWDDTTNAATRLQAVRTLTATAMVTVSAAETGGSTADNRDLLIRQYVTDPVAAQTISGTIRAQIQARESNALANMRAQMVVRVVSNDGGTVRGTLYPGDLRTGAVAEWTAVLRSQRVPATGTSPPPDVTPVVVQAGDRIVIELGARAQNVSATNYSGEYRFGDNNGTDLSVGGAETVDLNPWVELSYVVAWLLEGTITSRIAAADTATVRKRAAAAVASAPKVRDTVVGIARRVRAIESRVTAADSATVRKHALAAVGSGPKVRDTVTDQKNAVRDTVASTPKVRDVFTSRKHSAVALATSPKVRDTATTRKRSAGLAADTVTVADTVTGTTERSQPAAAKSTVTVADALTDTRHRGGGIAAERVTVAGFVGSESASNRNGTPPTTTINVVDTLDGTPRGAGVVRTNVLISDTITIGTGVGGSVDSTVVASTFVTGGAVNRVPADITSAVHVADTVAVAASTFRDITVTAALETTSMYRASREFLRVVFTADVTLDQRVDLQLTATRLARPNRRRRITLPVDAAWEPAQWVGEPSGVRRARLLYDAAGRGTRPGVYAVHARLADRPESVVLVNVGLLTIT